MAEAAPAPDVLRFDADPGIERREARLRIVLAVLVLLASAWLLLTPGWVLRAIAAMSGAFALSWLARSLRALREPPVRSTHDGLELTPEGLLQVAHGRAQRVAWQEVAAVRLDEDRLTIVLELHTGAEVEVPPRYPGVPLRELGEAIAGFHSRFRAAAGSSQGPAGTSPGHVTEGARREGDG